MYIVSWGHRKKRDELVSTLVICYSVHIICNNLKHNNDINKLNHYIARQSL